MPRRIKLDRRICEVRAKEILRSTEVQRHPVQVDRIAKEHGIKIRYEPLDDELSGMIFIKDNHAVIGVNAHHTPNRQRFTIAHELGHYFLHTDILRQGAHVDTVVTMLQRHQGTALGAMNIEIEANQFAAELLMPKQLIHDYLNAEGPGSTAEPDDAVIESMAKAFKVSTTALAIRLATVL